MDRSTATIQYVRVDHRGLDVLVPRQLLQKSSANVVAVRPPEIPVPGGRTPQLKRFSDLRVNNFSAHRTMPVSGCVFGQSARLAGYRAGKICVTFGTAAEETAQSASCTPCNPHQTARLAFLLRFAFVTPAGPRLFHQSELGTSSLSQGSSLQLPMQSPNKTGVAPSDKGPLVTSVCAVLVTTVSVQVLAKGSERHRQKQSSSDPQAQHPPIATSSAVQPMTKSSMLG